MNWIREELVLRSSTGSLLSAQWLMSTLCHEVFTTDLATVIGYLY